MSDAESSDIAVSAESDQTSTPNRRNALVSIVTGFLSFLLVVVPSTIGGIFFLDPLIRRRKSGGDKGGDLEGFLKLPITADAVPTDGTPVPISVRADQDDAWNHYNDVPVGSIWLRKTTDGSFQIFNSVCPHLGCRVGYRAGENDFFCPCHTSAFSLDGEKKNDIPPRDMDSLDVVVVANGKRDDSGNEIWVKFQNFRGGTPEKKPI